MKKMDKYVSLLLSVLLVPFLLAACIVQQTPAPTPTSQSTSPLPTTEASTVRPGFTLEPSPTPQPQTPTSTSMPTLSPTPLPSTATLTPLPPTPTVTPLPPTPTLTPAHPLRTGSHADYGRGIPARERHPSLRDGRGGGPVHRGRRHGGCNRSGVVLLHRRADGIVVKAMGEAHVRTVVPSTQDITSSWCPTWVR